MEREQQEAWHLGGCAHAHAHMHTCMHARARSVHPWLRMQWAHALGRVCAPAQGMRSNDIGGGHPAVIIADIDSTAALMAAAAEAPPSAFYHSSNLLLYLDEPNMGLELDPRCAKGV